MFKTVFSTGRSSTLPNTGSRLRKPSIVGKNPLNNAQKPYASTQMPTSAHLIRIRKTPIRKKADPFQFFFLKKNRRVARGPIVVATPARKSKFPMASSPRSKKNNTPRKVKRRPKAVRPTPIFRRSSNMLACAPQVLADVTFHAIAAEQAPHSQAIYDPQIRTRQTFAS